MSWPCLCGASDCRRCHPHSWWEEAAEEALGIEREAAEERAHEQLCKALGREDVGAEPRPRQRLRDAVRVVEAMRAAAIQDLRDGLDDDEIEMIGTLADVAEDLRDLLADTKPTTIHDIRERAEEARAERAMERLECRYDD